MFASKISVSKLSDVSKLTCVSNFIFVYLGFQVSYYPKLDWNRKKIGKFYVLVINGTSVIERIIVQYLFLVETGFN